LVIGVDGLPLTKSSSSSFWPILGYARDFSIKPNVFLIGLYRGKEKPSSSNSFLNDLVDELKYLADYGMDTDFGKKIVKVDTFCCDTPAKSFNLCTKGHVGYYSCPRCTINGVRVNNTTSFLGTNFPKRTHSDFINRADDEHHIGNTVSNLTQIPYLNMVDDFSIDYMHLACLGVVKKVILLWLGILKKAPVLVRIQSHNVNIITNRLLSIKPNVTCDFSRKPRGLNEVLRWKATEFRSFLLYTGPIVLKGILLNECYIHFICLHVAFRILLSPNISEKMFNFSEKLLIHFVEKFEELYGEQFVSQNIHGLIHIIDDYKKFGSLDKCSCFPFENYMKFLKKMVRKHEKPLEQVINRYQEFITFNKPLVNNNSNVSFKKEHSNGPLTEHYTGPQFQILIKNNLKINTKSGSDVYIGFKEQNKLSIFKILNICHDPRSGKNVLLSKSFTQVEPFFDKPINSLKLGIAKVGNLSKNFTIIDIETEFSKYMIMYDYSLNHSIAYPIIHTYYE